MSEKKLSQNILKAIEEKDIKPKPKWQFLLHEWVLWVVGAALILLGALAFSVIAFQLKTNDWAIHDQLGLGFARFLFSSIPYVWLIVLGLFILLAHYQIQHTKRAYKYPVYGMVLILVGLSSVFGMFFYSIGIGRAVNDNLSKRSPIYRQLADRKSDRWAHPEHGFLAGHIIEIDNDKELTLKDFNGEIWEIELDLEGDLRFPLKEKMKVRAIGEEISDNEFRAEMVLPWELNPEQRSRLK